MNQFDILPVWAALLVGFCLVAGAAITLAGTIGLARFKTFYQRIHAPTLGTSFGAAVVLLGSMIFFTVTETRPVLHEVLILVFVIVTTPVTLMLLARAALYRDRAEGNDVAPEDAAMSNTEPEPGEQRR